MAKKDDNNEALALAVDEADGSSVLPVQVDENGALLVTIRSASSGGTKPAAYGDPIERDDNNRPAARGVLDSDGTPYPFLIDDAGLLKIDNS